METEDRMQLYCLSDNPNKPCYVMVFKGVTLMLDCALDMVPALNFMPLPLVHSTKLSLLPRASINIQKQGSSSSLEQPIDSISALLADISGELRESTIQGRVYVDSPPEFGLPDLSVVDLSNIDAIVISNYTNVLSLPYVTEETGFNGMIFMTEPCLHFGRLFMEETIEFIERSSSDSRKNRNLWKDMPRDLLPPPLNDAINPRAWKTIYSRKQMEACLSKVTLVGFSEKKDIFGLLTVSPISSGYCIGSSNWVITSGYEKIAYVSGSSSLTTHPRPMDQSPLRNLDCMILTSLTQAPTLSPDAMIGDFCKAVLDTTRNNGNVLVPCYPAGVAYDLLECLASQMDLQGQSGIPMFFIGPVADSSLAYSNIMAEWLTPAKQNRVYTPEEPFPHGSLSKTGRLKSFRNLYDESFNSEYRQPCIMFCGHPSLRFGDVIHFIELWGNNPNNTIVFTEPSISYLEALTPFQPLLMKTVHTPIDTSLNFNQAKKLIKDLKPASVAIPKQYSVPPITAPQRSELTIDVPEIPRYTFGRYESIKLPIKPKYDRIDIDPELAGKIAPVEVKPGIAAVSVSGNLSVMNNKYTLRDLGDDDGPSNIQSQISQEIPGNALHGSRKRKSKMLRQHQKASNLGSSGGAAIRLPLKMCRSEGILHGNLDVKYIVERLSSVKIFDARVEEVSTGNFIIHLNKEEALIQIDTVNRKTHVVCNEGAEQNRELTRVAIRDVILACLEKL